MTHDSPSAGGVLPTEKLADPNLRRLIIRLALPAIAGLSINALHHLANIFYLSMLGGGAVSAVSSLLPLLILLGAVGEALGVGAGSCVSRLLGAGKLEDASRAATTGLALAIMAGLAVSLTLPFHLDGALALAGVTSAAAPLAKSYLQIILISYTLLLLQIYCDFLAISEGNARFSMFTLIGAFSLNMVLDPIFIFVLELGIEGAAYATLCAQVAAVTAYAIYFIAKLGAVSVAWRFFKPDWRTITDILAVGGPAALASCLLAFAFALVYSAAAKYGDAEIVAMGVALRFFNFGALPVFGFCLGARPVLGFNWGAGNYPRVLATLRFMVLATTGFCAAYALVILCFASPLASFFSNDSLSRDAIFSALVALFALFPLFGLQTVLTSFLQASGKSALALFVLLAPQGYFLIPCVLILPPIWGFPGLLASAAIASGLTALMAAYLLWRQASGLRRLEPGLQSSAAFS